MAGALAGFLLLGTAACGASSATPVSADSSTSLASAHVEIFVPSDGIPLTQNNPTNKWGSFADDISKQLVKKGYSADSISIVTSGSLKDQAKALEDHVKETSEDKATGTHDVVLLAPAFALDSTTKHYGTLLGDGTQPLSTGVDSAASQNDDDALTETEAEKSLAASAKKMRAKGTSVILMARSVPNLSADAFVKTTNAYDIGKLQATQMEAKLELSQAKTTNPKRIEVLVPEESDTSISADFFNGVWSVLGKYFSDGTVVSPSGRLTTTSTKDDWSDALLASDTASEAKNGFDSVLSDGALNDSDDADGSIVRLDGVIAANDYVATQVTSVLKDRGYTGSAADINPEITLGGIVGNMAGNADITKGKVPSPSKDEDENSGSLDDDSSSNADSDNDDFSQWPIVTGYGSYVGNIQLVVGGKQWLTGLENRNGLAVDIATTCVSIAKGKGAKVSSGQSTATVNGAKVPLITRTLVGVVSSNLKTELIDTGYITAADAGL